MVSQKLGEGFEARNRSELFKNTYHLDIYFKKSPDT